MKLRQRSRILAGAVIWLFLTSSSFAITISTETMEEFLSTYVTPENDDATFDIDSYKSAIERLYFRLGDTDSPGAQQLHEFILSLPTKKMISAEQARNMFQSIAPHFDDPAYAELQIPMIMLLHPYVKEAGGCQADPNDSSKELCLFGSRDNSGVNGQAAFTFPDGTTMNAVVPAPETDLAYILTPIGCSHVADPGPAEGEGGNFTASFDPHDHETETDAGYKNTQCYQFRWKSFLAYEYDVDASLNAKIWAEIIVAAQLRTSAVIADTAFVDLPVSLSCNYNCVTESLFNCLDEWREYGDKAALLCMARRANKTHKQIHSGGSYVDHIISRSCEFPVPVQTRTYFNAYQSGAYSDYYDLPPEADGFVNKDDLKFQTYSQEPSSDPVIAVNGINMYPLPTLKYEALLASQGYGAGATHWSHKFKTIEGWRFNIIYGAFDVSGISPGGFVQQHCQIDRKHKSNPSLSAYGTKQIAFRGTPANLREYNLIFGFNNLPNLQLISCPEGAVIF